MAATTWRTMPRVLGAWLAAVVTAYVFATIAHTQTVLWSLDAMGVEVQAADRFAATGHDLLGMASSYLPVIALGFAIAFPVAALVVRFMPWRRPMAYPLAGGVALLAIHVLMYQLLSITPVAAARTTLGLTVQALCGVLGGWVFLRFLPPRPRAASGSGGP